jgi:hypothetical protein
MHSSPTSATEDADAALLTRYVAGDQSAARLLAASLTPRMYAHGLRVLGDAAEAEDVVQEAMRQKYRRGFTVLWQTCAQTVCANGAQCRLSRSIH